MNPKRLFAFYTKTLIQACCGGEAILLLLFQGLRQEINGLMKSTICPASSTAHKPARTSLVLAVVVLLLTVGQQNVNAQCTATNLSGFSGTGGWALLGSVYNNANNNASASTDQLNLNNIGGSGRILQTFVFAIRFSNGGGGNNGNNSRLYLYYNGVLYFNALSTVAGNSGNSTVTASNGASVSPNGGVAVDVTGTYTLTLPANIATGGQLSWRMDGGGGVADDWNVHSTSYTSVPSSPVVGTVTQPTCALNSGSVALSGLPSTGTWTVTASPGGLTKTGTGTTTTFTGLPPSANYTFTVAEPSSCVSANSTASATIGAAAAPPSAVNITGSSTTLCQNATATALTASFTGSTATGYQWLANGTIIPGATNSTYTPPTSATGVITYTVTVSNACGNATSASGPTITVATAPSFVGQPTNQSGCVGGNINYTTTAANAVGYLWFFTDNAGGSYSPITEGMSDGSGGTYANVATATLTHTNVSTATNGRQYLVQLVSGCGVASNINSNRVTETASVCTASICTNRLTATSSNPALGTVAGVPYSVSSTIASAVTNWNSNPFYPGYNMVGITVVDQSITVTFNTPVQGVEFDAYSVSNANGSREDVKVLINGLPYTLQTANLIQTPTSNTLSTNTVSIVGGVIVSNGNNASCKIRITGIPGGISSIQIITDYISGPNSVFGPEGCAYDIYMVSGPAINGTLNACLNGTTQLSSPDPAAAVGPWLSSNPAVATVNNTGLVTGVLAGTATITYTNNVGCSSPVTITVAACPPTIAITSPVNVTTASTNPPISGTATALASVTVLGTNSQSCTTTANASGAWSCTGLTFTMGSQTVTAVASNTGGLSTVATSSFTVVCAAGTSAPALSATTKSNVCPATTVDLTTLSASNTPAGTSQTWHTGSPATTANKITGTAVGAGTYYTAFFDATGACYSPPTSVTVTINVAPATPTAVTATQPTCSVATGTFTISNYSATNTYTVSPSAGVSQSGATVTAPAGTYTIQATANGCSSVASAGVTLNAAPATPATPTAATATQPTCSVATGTFTISNYSAANTYTFSPSAGVSQSGATVTAPAGTYTIQATANGCTSVASAPVTINVAPACLPTIAITTPKNVTITSTNPPISGTATASASITVNAPNGQTCFTTADVTGAWSCTSLVFTVGSQTVTAIASNTAGVSTIATASFTVVGPLCPNPTVGGTATYAGGALCDVSNAGTVTLAGQTGTVVKWQTSPNGTTWTDIAGTSGKALYSFVNATNGQQFRAVLNNAGGCLDAFSTPATISTSPTACSSATCDKSSGSVAFTVTPATTGSNFSHVIIMTNGSGVIQYASAPGSSTVIGVATGNYLVYLVSYDNTQLPLPTLTAGTSLSGVGGACVAYSSQLALKVCPPAPAFVFNCTNATSSGAFLANGTAGQSGALTLPITVTSPGAVTLLVSGTGFVSSPTPFATTLTAGQTSIAVPILYDGTGTAGTRTLTVTSASATGTCSPTVVVSVLEIPCTPVQPGIASASAASIQTGQVASFSLSQYAPASAAVTWTIVPSAGVSQATGTGTSTGSITFLIAGNYSIIYNIVNSSVPVGCNLSANSFATARLVVTSPPTLCQTPSPGIATVAPSSAAIPVNGTASVGLTGGTPNTNISWIVIPSAGVSQAAGVGANTGTLTFTTPGLYQVVYTIYNAGDGTCLPVQNTAEAMISVGLNPCFPPSPITIISSVANNTSVSGSAVTFTAVGGFSGAMSWTVTPGAGASPASGTGNVATVNFGQTGGYVITFLSSNSTTPIGCTAPTLVSSSTSHSVVAPKLPPLVTPDIANTNINTPVSGNVLTNDSDPNGGTLTVSLTSGPTTGTVTLTSTGSYTYTPPTGFTGVVSFCYSATNTAGLSASTCVTINVLPVPSPQPGVNNPPVANNDATQTTQGVSVTIAVAANDTDPDSATSANGQLGVPTLLGQPASGTASVVNGQVVYTPPANFTGVVSFPYQICDLGSSQPSCATALVTVNVQPTPPVATTLAPVAVDDALVTSLNTPKSGNVSTNDSDPQGLPLIFTTGQPASGTVVMSPTGSYTYTPAAGFVGPTSFTYSVCNSAGKCDVATVSVLVEPGANQPPVVIGEPLVTKTGVPVTLCLPIVDADLSDTHSVTLCGQPTSGTLTASVNNTNHTVCLTYTPTSTFSGPLTACVTVCDAAGACTTTIVPITVVPVSQTATTPLPPVVVVEPLVTTKGVPVTVCMPITDPNLTDTHSVSVCGVPGKGTATASVNNLTHTVCVVYTPTSTSTGNDQICLTVCDNTGLCTTVTVPVSIVDPTPPGPGVEPPVVTPTPIVTIPTQPVIVCTGITDSPTDSHTATLCGLPSSGTVAVGVDNVTHALCVTYTPGNTAPVSTSVCVMVCDQTGQCTTVILPITVLPVSQPPVLTPDIANTNLNTPVTGNVLTNDVDPQGGPLTVSLTSGPTTGTVTLTSTGSYTYTPPTGFTGVVSFCYSATNTAGLSASTCVTINVLPVPSPQPGVNNPPVANNDATQTTAGTSVTINVAANDTDPDSATTANGQLGVPGLLGQPASGTASVVNGQVVYTPPANFTGVVTFPYQICDLGSSQPSCATALVTVNVQPTPPVNTTLAPVAVDDALVTSLNTPKSGNVSTNDSDPNSPALPLIFTTGQPASGTVVMSPTGSYTYTPAAGFVGPTSFTYSVCNSAGKCDVATVSVLVQPGANQPPVVIGEPLVTKTGVPVTLCLPIVDADLSDTHSVTLCGQPTSGTLTASVNNTNHTVCLTYTPTSTFSGPLTACVTVCDAAGACTTTIVPITVVPVSQTATTPLPPVVVVEPLVTTKGVPVTVCMPITDPNLTDTHSVSVCGVPGKGTATASVNNLIHTVCVVYTPTSTSTGNDQICLTVCDNTGLCTTVTVPVSIVDPTPPGPGVEPPVVTPTPIVTIPTQPVIVCTGITDSPTDSHTATLCGLPSSGTVAVGVDNVTHALCVTYTPGNTAPVSTSVCIQVCDQTGQCTTVILPITVLPVSQPPVLTPDIANTNLNTPVTGNVLTNDVDPQGGPLTASLLNQPTSGTVTLSPTGSYTYTPPTGFTGVVSFCYSATNTAGLSASTCVSINVLPVPSPAVNNPPVANNDATQTTAGTSVTINVAANDTDPDSVTSLNGQLGVPTLVSQPASGTASVVNGQVVYTPPANFTGVVTFPYQICDLGSSQPSCATALVTVNVQPTPPVSTTLAPVAVDDALVTSLNTPKTGNVSTNDSDPNSPALPLIFTTGQPASGTVVMSPTGSYTYTPAPGFVGPTSFTYSVCNSAGKCDVATVSVLVQAGANQPPVVIGEPLVTKTGVPVTLCLPIVDADLSDTHSVTLCGQPTSGTLTASVTNTNHTVCLTYTPTSTFSGPLTACITVCDQAGACTTTIVPITVVPVSQTATTPLPPVVVVEPLVTTKGVPVTVCMPITDPNLTDTHSVSVCGVPGKGTATATVNNTNHTVCVVYTPTSTSTGNDQICLTVCDNTGLCTTVTVPVSIVDPTPPGPGVEPPVVTPTPIVTIPTQPVIVCTGITDSPTDSHTATLCGLPSSGTVAVGVDNVTHALCVTYTPGNTAPVSTSVCVMVCDQTGQCTTVILPITVLPVSQPPVLTPDIANTNLNTPVTGNVLTNDVDPQGGPLTASLLNQPTSGTVTLSPTGSYTYTPPTGFTGVVSFCYSASNTAGLSASTCVSINVNPTPSPAVNNRPVANNDATQTTAGVSVTINVAANDTDPDSVTSLNGQLGVPGLLGQPASGTASVVNGQVVYTPPANFTGVVTFPYQICDKATPAMCATAVVTVNVQPTPPVNTTLAPVAVDDALVTSLNTPKSGNVSTNDSDPQGLPLIFTTGQPASGTVVMSPPGSYTYTPAAGFVGPTSFTYSVCNSAGKCDVATVSVLVQPGANQPPVVIGEPLVTKTGVPVTLCLPIVDADLSDTHSVTLCGQPTSGTLTASVDNVTHAVCLTYTPTSTFSGPLTACITVCDQAGNCTTTIVPITVVPVSQTATTPLPPVVVVEPLVTTKGVPVTVCMPITDPNLTDTHSVSVCGVPGKGTATASVNNLTHTVCVVYTPTSTSTGNDQICLTVCDNTGLCTTVTVPVSIVDPTPPGPGVEPPVVTPTPIVTIPTQPVIVCTGITDSPTDSHTATLCGLPASGTVAVGVDNVTHALCVTYTPGNTAPVSTSVCIQVCDQTGQCTTVILPITVLPVSQPPVLTPDIANTNLNTPVTGNVLTNDVDPQGGPLTASLLNQPTSGTVTLSPTGSYTYTPPTGFTGVASFCYSATNTAGLSASTCVSINVLPVPSPQPGVNNRPVANNDATQTTAGVSVTINVVANDTDPDSATTANGQLGVPGLLGQPASGTASVVNGQVVYTPPANFTGVVTFPYQICDLGSSQPSCATALVTVNVQPTPPVNTTLAPVAVDDALVTSLNTPKSGNVSTNDSDPQGLPLIFTTGQPASGTVVMSPTGSYTYTPAAGFVGPTSFTYSVCNSAGKCDVATVSVLVQAAPAVVLRLKVLLQGALIGSTGGLMRDDLRSKGFLPSLEPYTAIGGTRFTHVNGGGGETMPASVTGLNAGTGDAVVDWVFVELRSPSNLSLVVATRSALVQRDGDVVLASDGVSPLSFSGLTGNSYYVSVKHRNHLGVMTATAIPLSLTGTVVDFTTMDSSRVWNKVVGAFNYEGWEQITVSGKQALWAGDANHDGKVKYQGGANDLITIFSEVLALSPLYNYDNAFGYYFGDVNMDGKVKYQGATNDTSLIFTNLLTNYRTSTRMNSAQLYNFDFMLEQIP